MIIINQNGEFITGSVNGEQFSITFDQEKFYALKDCERKAQSVSTIAELQELVAQVKELAKESYKELVQTASPYLFVNKHTNKYFLKFNNTISSKALPKEFVEKILKSVDKKLDISPLVKCIARFLRNEKFTDSKFQKFADYICAPYVNQEEVERLVSKEGFTRERATEKATTSQVAITMEGLLVGYKVSEEVLTRFTLNEEEEVVQKSRYTKSVDQDTGLITYAKPEHVEERLFRPAIMKDNGDAFVCRWADSVTGEVREVENHHIRVGATHFLPKGFEQVNCNDNTSAVKGLHVGGLSYIKSFQREGTVTHNVLIDPADIGAICDVGPNSDGALRVRRYFVHSSFAGVNKNIYHSSTYAAMNDAEYAKLVQEAVEAHRVKLSGLEAELAEKRSYGTATPTSAEACTDRAQD